MNSAKSILERINNLISDDSKVLKEYNDRIEKANESKSKAEEEKKSFENDITNIQSDIDEISKASEVSQRFSDLELYMPGLKKLGKSVSLLESLKEELGKIPEQIEKLENNIKDLTEQSDNRTKIIEEANDELSKLDVEISDAKRYQENLIELIDLAKSGNINKTREEVVETLIHVGFNDKEAISAAKVILFPEDDLMPFFNKTTDSNVEEKKEEPLEEVKEEKKVEETSIKEDNNVSETDDELDKFIENETEIAEENSEIENEKKEVETVPTESEDISLEQEIPEISLETIDDEEKLSPVSVATNMDLDEVKKMIEDYGFDSSKFDDDDLDAEKSVIRENISFIFDKNLSKEFVYKYPSVLSDSDIKSKYKYIIEVLNKTDEDIKLTPEVLASYSKEDLEKLVDVIKQSGIEPSLIPLSIYQKGLQPLLRNYMLLKDNNIELDDNELSKFAAILAINPVDFKKSLQVILDYKLSLKKNDGKIAIMDLAVKDLELANKMDMIIGIGEEDLIKFYPEVLSTDVKELVNRLLFLQKSDIPYKTESHNKVIYQSFVLHQDVLDRVLEKHIDIDELLDKNETNNNLKELLNNEDIIKELDNVDNNFELISNYNGDEYQKVLNLIDGKYKESESAYIINEYHFSKNKVNRDINYLLSIFTDIDNNIILLASLLYNSRLAKEDMKEIIDILDIKVK